MGRGVAREYKLETTGDVVKGNSALELIQSCHAEIAEMEKVLEELLGAEPAVDQSGQEPTCVMEDIDMCLDNLRRRLSLAKARVYEIYARLKG